MKKTLAFVLFFVLAIAAGARAENWTALSKRLYDQCLDFNEAVKDITLVMQMVNPSSDGDITTESKLFQKRNKFRAEIMIGGFEGKGNEDIEGMKTIIIDDGTAVWIVNPAMGKSQMPPSEGRKYRGQWYCSEYIPALAEIEGSETVGGRDCWILLVKDEDADYSRIWIDKETLVLVKLESKPEEGEPTTALFSDYRKIAGDHELPHKTEIYAGPDLISTIVVRSVTVNTGLSDDLFDADAASSEAPAKLQDMMKRTKNALKKIER
jgi:outer membrane lipoprotein-sorting protein